MPPLGTHYFTTRLTISRKRLYSIVLLHIFAVETSPPNVVLLGCEKSE